MAGILLKNGYGPERVGVMGCGEYRPAADNASETGRSNNRRVEIYLVPAGSIIQTAQGWRAGDEAVAFARLTR